MQNICRFGLHKCSLCAARFVDECLLKGGSPVQDRRLRILKKSSPWQCYMSTCFLIPPALLSKSGRCRNERAACSNSTERGGFCSRNYKTKTIQLELRPSHCYPVSSQ